MIGRGGAAPVSASWRLAGFYLSGLVCGMSLWWVLSGWVPAAVRGEWFTAVVLSVTGASLVCTGVAARSLLREMARERALAARFEASVCALELLAGGRVSVSPRRNGIAVSFDRGADEWE